MPRTDRRIEKTQAAIRAAFTQLLSEMDYDAITVSAIAKRANIDRKTFYLHYKGKEDLLKAIEAEHAHVVAQMLSSLNWEDGDHLDTSALSAEAARDFAESGPTYRRIARAPSSFFIMVDELGGLRAAFQDLLRDHIACTPRELAVYAEFFAGGILSTYWHWLRSDDPMPLEELVTTAANAAHRGLAGILQGRAQPA